MTVKTIAARRGTFVGVTAVILGLAVVISLLVTGAFGPASAQEGDGVNAAAPASSSGNGDGIVGTSSPGPSAPSGPITVDGPWYEIAQAGAGNPVTGCSPADPAGPGCVPSSAGNSVFADAPP